MVELGRQILARVAAAGPALPRRARNEYADRAQSFADRLVWKHKISPTTVVNSDGSYTRSYRYRGRDLTAASLEYRNAINERLNRLFRDFQKGWMFHVDLDRRETTHYPSSQYPDVASWLIEEADRLHWEATRHYISDLYLTITHKAPTSERVRRSNLLYIYDAQDPRTDANQALRTFEEGCIRFETSFAQDFTLEPLGLRLVTVPNLGPTYVDDQLAYFTSCATGKRQDVMAIPVGGYVNEYCASETLFSDTTLRVGRTLVRPLSIVNVPERSTPAILDILDQISGSYRVNWRYIPEAHDRALREIKDERKANKQKRRGALDTWTEKSDALVDPEADRMMDDAEHAFGQARSKTVTFGWLSLSIILTEPIDRGESIDECRARQDETFDRVVAALQTRSFQTSFDDGNHLEVFEGSLPAHGHPNVVRGMLSSRNFANYMPTTSVWPGEPHAPHEDYPRNAPSLAVFATNGATPHYFNLHVNANRGGHTLFVGETGTGKSTLLAYILNKHRRYNTTEGGAQQIIIDRDYQHYVHCRAVGGTHVVVGPGTSVGFAPFTHIDDRYELEFAERLVRCMLREVGVDPRPHTDTIYQALFSLAQSPPDQRTLSHLIMQPYMTSELAKCLKQFTIEGAGGLLFDSVADTFERSDFIVFEVGPLIGEGILHRPGMLMLLHAIERMCSKRIKTLLVSEEFWALLDDEDAANAFRSVLKTYRRKNVAAIVVTQSMTDLERGNIASVVTGSCPTKIILPNELANSTENAKRLRDLDLQQWEIDALVDLAGEHAFYLVQPVGRRMLSSELSEIALATVGVTSHKRIEVVDRFIREYGNDWYPEWLYAQISDKTAAENWRRHLYWGAERGLLPPSPTPIAPEHAAMHSSDPEYASIPA